jgi:7-cyano-7-deazaguanine synthase in queuosine biosynthesis
MKIVILYSGGLDSFLMYHWATKHYPDAEVKCIFYAHGQDSEQAEIAALPEFVEVRKIDWLNETLRPVAKQSDPFAGAIYIPGRNLVFSALAASQELANEVWMGTVWDEDNQQATDKNERFRSATSELLSYVLSPFVKNVVVRFPFVENKMTKESCVRWALENGIVAEQLTHTVSCWDQQTGKPCGVCKQCLKRMFVFGLNGFEEEYEVHPLSSPAQQALIIKYLEDVNNPRIDSNEDEKNMADMIRRYFKTHPVPNNDWGKKLKLLLIR